ncbi:HNH endonuclease [Halobacterium hubeiense]|uniref:HNH endonuclease n=1 Tax=Halobacterium hubeiense TaxID=1407499 RepID=UPI000B7FE334|nr:HNH endonuclease [Halobacterium hubeiense]
MSDDGFREAVYAAWGQECLVCGQSPEEWVESETRTQTTLSLHHINGDDTDDRVANVIPLCQDCHIHIHKVDEPPYRQWHRQLPVEHWNAHYKEFYEGPRLTSKQAEWFFGDDTPRIEKYRRHEQTTLERDAGRGDDLTPAILHDVRLRESNAVSNEPEVDTDTGEPRRGVDPDLDPETVSIEFTPADADRRRIRFVERDDGPGWWQLHETWTGHRWRPLDRKPVTDVDITTY